MFERIYSRVTPDEFIELESDMENYLTIESMYHPSYDQTGRQGEAYTLNNFVTLDKSGVRKLIDALEEAHRMMIE